MQFSNITTTMIFLCFNQLIQEKDMYVTCDFQDLIHPLHYNIGRNGEDTSARVLLRLIEYFFLLFLGGFIPVTDQFHWLSQHSFMQVTLWQFFSPHIWLE